MADDSYSEINLGKLKILAAKWAKECTPYINEITLYTATNAHTRKYIIDIVVNDPPKIEPELGYIGSGRADYLIELSEVRIPQTKNKKGIISWGNLWDINVRWETDGLHPYAVEEGKIVLYRRVTPISFDHTFAELNIDKLKKLAHEWVKDYREAEPPVNIETVTLYKYRPNIHTRAKIEEKCESNDPMYAIVFELNCEGEKPTIKILNNIDLISFTNGCKFAPYANFISQNTDHLSGYNRFPGIFQTGFKEVYRKAKTKEEFKKTLVYQWVFYPFCKGIDLSPSVRVDEGFVVLYTGNITNSMDNHREGVKKMMPDSYHGDPDDVIAERNEKKEQAVWDKNIKPLLDMHYHGVFQYKFFPEPTMITRGDLDSMLRKTMLLCHQGYDLVFPTDIFEKEVMKRLKTGQTSFQTNSFDKNGTPISIDIKGKFQTFLQESFDKKTLPIFLTYLDLEYPEGIWPMTQIEISQDAKNKTEKLQSLQSTNDIYNQTLKDYCPDIDLFWELLKRKAKSHSGSIDAIKPGVFYDLAIEAFEEQTTELLHLKKHHLDDRKIYSPFTERRRRVIGNILLKIITERCPQALSPQSGINTTIEGLFKQFKDIQKPA